MKAHQIDYIPGCVELGDFDATSTTIALWPCNEAGATAQGRARRTRSINIGTASSSAATIRRSHGSTTRPTNCARSAASCSSGQPERAQQALEFFMNDRRPPGWNQWPEVVHRDPRAAKFIGDLPHTWCGSDFVNSVRMMFLYEREADDARGAARWRARRLGFGPAHRVSKLADLWRPPDLHFVAVRAIDEDKLLAHLEGNCPIPAGKLRLSVPTGRAASATVNGAPAEIDADGRVVVNVLPADVEVTIVPKTGAIASLELPRALELAAAATVRRPKKGESPDAAYMVKLPACQQVVVALEMPGCYTSRLSHPVSRGPAVALHRRLTNVQACHVGDFRIGVVGAAVGDAIRLRGRKSKSRPLRRPPRMKATHRRQPPTRLLPKTRWMPS